jgi:hypothetical protein
MSRRIHLKIGYHLRSLAETAMSRMKMQFGERLSLRLRCAGGRGKGAGEGVE